MGLVSMGSSTILLALLSVSEFIAAFFIQIELFFFFWQITFTLNDLMNCYDCYYWLITQLIDFQILKNFSHHDMRQLHPSVIVSNDIVFSFHLQYRHNIIVHPSSVPNPASKSRGYVCPY